MGENTPTYYRRNLPHYQPAGAAFFVTFRLANSLPREAIERLRSEQRFEEKRLLAVKDIGEREKKMIQLREQYFSKFDQMLDKVEAGPKWLREDRVAKIVADAMDYRDGKDYELIVYCIMPNHVHMVINVERSDTSLYRILQSLKAYTARECNRVLHRSGAFWQHESYDHVIRNEKEFEKIIWYILNNPVKAGLVDDWKEWKWTYCKYDL